MVALPYHGPAQLGPMFRWAGTVPAAMMGVKRIITRHAGFAPVHGRGPHRRRPRSRGTGDRRSPHPAMLAHTGCSRTPDARAHRMLVYTGVTKRRAGIGAARTHGVPMSPRRRTALVAGTLYLLTFVSIPTLALYGPVREPGYIAGPGPRHRRDLGRRPGNGRGSRLHRHRRRALPGTQTAQRWPRGGLRRHTGPGRCHYLLPASVASIAILMSVVSLRRAGAGTEALLTGQALIALRDWTFLLGQDVLPAVNALC
jgi:hypothetical protein